MVVKQYAKIETLPSTSVDILIGDESIQFDSCHLENRSLICPLTHLLVNDHSFNIWEDKINLM